MNAVLEGMNIIAKYEPDADVAAQHDQIFFGAYDPEKMTTEELKIMKKLGWEEEEDSWCIYV